MSEDKPNNPGDPITLSPCHLVTLSSAEAAQFSTEAEPPEVQAWEEVDTGRFMPRRIKGSCKGRALG
jgi:hypothetical protein